MGAIYVECSSKEMSGVNEVFELAVDTAVQREIKMKEQRPLYQQDGMGAETSNRTFKKSKRRGPCTIL